MKLERQLSQAMRDNVITAVEVAGWMRTDDGSANHRGLLEDSLEHWADHFEPDARTMLQKHLGFPQTETNIEGPFYKPNAPERPNGVIPGKRDGAVPLTVTGKVVDTDGKRVPSAKLDVWQADGAGAYDYDGYDHRGVIRADEKGDYRMQTIIPGRYLNGDTYRPAHLHVKVTAPGMKPLTTQLYFEGDPYNASDPFIRESLIMPLTDDGAGKAAEFKFVLGKVRDIPEPRRPRGGSFDCGMTDGWDGPVTPSEQRH